MEPDRTVEEHRDVVKSNTLVTIVSGNYYVSQSFYIVPSPGSHPAPDQLFPTNPANGAQWVCPQCTLNNNASNQVCEACQLPRIQ